MASRDLTVGTGGRGKRRPDRQTAIVPSEPIPEINVYRREDPLMFLHKGICAASRPKKCCCPHGKVVCSRQHVALRRTTEFEYWCIELVPGGCEVNNVPCRSLLGKPAQNLFYSRCELRLQLDIVFEYQARFCLRPYKPTSAIQMADIAADFAPPHRASEVPHGAICIVFGMISRLKSAAIERGHPLKLYIRRLKLLGGACQAFVGFVKVNQIDLKIQSVYSAGNQVQKAVAGNLSTKSFR